MSYHSNFSIEARTCGEADEDVRLDRTDGSARNDRIFCVVYRTGGTENFQWHRTLGMTKKEAQAAYESTRRMGYRAMVVNYHQSLSIGLPETYE